VSRRQPSFLLSNSRFDDAGRESPVSVNVLGTGKRISRNPETRAGNDT